MSTIIIQTPRLSLRPLHPDDAPEIHAAKRVSWNELSRWGIWIFKPFAETGPEDDAQFCRYKQQQFTLRNDLTFRITQRDTGKFLGSVGLHECDWQQPSFKLGFWIRTDETHKGFATEAGNALARYAFKELGAAHLTSMHAHGNDASGRVLKKLGFSPVETRLGIHTLPDGRRVDEYHYVLSDAAPLPPLEVSW